MAENPNTVPVNLIPLPVDVQLQQVNGPDGSLWVRMVVTTPAGMNAYFWQGQAAVQLAEALVRLGRATTAGLTLPSQNGG